MNIDFSLWLLILSAVAGVVWLVDALVFAKARRKKVEEFLAARNLSAVEFQGYVESLDDEGKPRAATDTAPIDPMKQKQLEQAYVLNRESVPVEYAKSFFPILFAVLLLRSFLFEPFQIPTGSMIPTLNIGDFIVVNKFSYGLRLPVTGTKIVPIGEPKRGDVMVFIPPHDPNYFIKRVIGLPGEHVRYADNTIYINGEPVPQEEVSAIRELGVQHSRETIGGITHDIYTSLVPRSNNFTWMPPADYQGCERRGNLCEGWLAPEGMVIPEGHYFMMGDNRDNSLDSRYWGTVAESSIVGKAVAVWMQKEAGFHLPSFSENRLIENPE
ncbi:MAG: signal peptidase I [Pseudomonadota bacterium]|nr:signal peptidase I [Pseudomonadota bacterium]